MSRLNLGLALLVFAAPAIINADGKVCNIDVFDAMRTSKKGIEKSNELEQLRKDLTKNIETEGKRYEAAVNKFKSESSTLNDSARAKKEQELVKMKRDYENLVASSEEQMKLAMQQTTELLAKDVEAAVIQVAKAENIASVTDRVTGKVIYSKQELDYTPKVVDAMNRHFDAKFNSSTVVASNKATEKSEKSATRA